MGAINDYDKAVRSGGKRLHPRSEEILGIDAPKAPSLWSKINWSKVRFGLISLVALAFAYSLVMGLPKIEMPVKEIFKTTEKIVEVPVVKYKTKWRTKWRTKIKTEYVRNPVNSNLRESNRELRARIYKLEKQIAAHDLDRLVNDKLIKQFYKGAYENGYRVQLRYNGTTRTATP